MLMTFTYDDGTSETLTLDGELLELMAAQLGYYYPISSLTKDKFVVDKYKKIWTAELEKAIRSRIAQDNEPAVIEEVMSKLSGLSGGE